MTKQRQLCKLVATSRGPHLRKGVGEDNTRLNAASSDAPLLAATYDAIKELTRRGEIEAGTRTAAFTGPDGAVVQAGYSRLREKSLADASPDAVAFGAGAAIGIAVFPEHGQDIQFLLKRADADMYVRKHAGTGRTDARAS